MSKTKIAVTLIGSTISLIAGFFIKKKTCEKLVSVGIKKPTKVIFKHSIKLVNYGLPQKTTVNRDPGNYTVEEKKTDDGIIIVLKNTLIGAPKNYWSDQGAIFS